jgi:hypothetical protein
MTKVKEPEVETKDETKATDEGTQDETKSEDTPIEVDKGDIISDIERRINALEKLIQDATKAEHEDEEYEDDEDKEEKGKKEDAKPEDETKSEDKKEAETPEETKSEDPPVEEKTDEEYNTFVLDYVKGNEELMETITNAYDESKAEDTPYPDKKAFDDLVELVKSIKQEITSMKSSDESDAETAIKARDDVIESLNKKLENIEKKAEDIKKPSADPEVEDPTPKTKVGKPEEDDDLVYEYVYKDGQFYHQ